jgi:hypothetical protein
MFLLLRTARALRGPNFLKHLSAAFGLLGLIPLGKIAWSVARMADGSILAERDSFLALADYFGILISFASAAWFFFTFMLLLRHPNDKLPASWPGPLVAPVGACAAGAFGLAKVLSLDLPTVMEVHGNLCIAAAIWLVGGGILRFAYRMSFDSYDGLWVALKGIMVVSFVLWGSLRLFFFSDVAEQSFGFGIALVAAELVAALVVAVLITLCCAKRSEFMAADEGVSIVRTAQGVSSPSWMVSTVADRAEALGVEIK